MKPRLVPGCNLWLRLYPWSERGLHAPGTQKTARSTPHMGGMHNGARTYSPLFLASYAFPTPTAGIAVKNSDVYPA